MLPHRVVKPDVVGVLMMMIIVSELEDQGGMEGLSTGTDILIRSFILKHQGKRQSQSQSRDVTNITEAADWSRCDFYVTSRGFVAC